jgi:hypothetical protein
MKDQLKKVAGKVVGIAAAAQTAVLATVVHAQTSGALSGQDLFGGAGAGTTFAQTAGLGSQDLSTTIASIIRVGLGFLGVIAVVIVLYGGFLWMTSAGSDEKVKQAKKVMISGIIGLVIVLSAYALASFVINSISTATAG